MCIRDSLKASATAEAMEIVAEKLKNDPKAKEAMQYLMAQHYLEMGKEIGSSDSSKVMFMDPSNMVSTIEGMRSIISDPKKQDYTPAEFDLEEIKRNY